MSKTWWGWDVCLPPGTLVAGYPSSPLDSLRVSSRGYLPPHNMIVKALFPLLHCYLETAFILLLLKFCNQLLEEQKFSGHSPSFPARGLAHARTGTCAIHRSIWEAVFFAAHFRYRHVVPVKRCPCRRHQIYRAWIWGLTVVGRICQNLA